MLQRHHLISGIPRLDFCLVAIHIALILGQCRESLSLSRYARIHGVENVVSSRTVMKTVSVLPGIMPSMIIYFLYIF